MFKIKNKSNQVSCSFFSVKSVFQKSRNLNLILNLNPNVDVPRYCREIWYFHIQWLLCPVFSGGIIFCLNKTINKIKNENPSNKEYTNKETDNELKKTIFYQILITLFVLCLHLFSLFQSNCFVWCSRNEPRTTAP